MKKIELRSFLTEQKFIVDGKKERESVEFTYADLLKSGLNQTPQEGFTPLEMSVRLDIIKKIDAAVAKKSKHLVLEDAEFEKVIGLMSTHKYALMDVGLVEFDKHLQEVKDSKVD